MAIKAAVVASFSDSSEHHKLSRRPINIRRAIRAKNLSTRTSFPSVSDDVEPRNCYWRGRQHCQTFAHRATFASSGSWHPLLHALREVRQRGRYSINPQTRVTLQRLSYEDFGIARIIRTRDSRTLIPRSRDRKLLQSLSLSQPRVSRGADGLELPKHSTVRCSCKGAR